MPILPKIFMTPVHIKSTEILSGVSAWQFSSHESSRRDLMGHPSRCSIMSEQKARVLPAVAALIHLALKSGAQSLSFSSQSDIRSHLVLGPASAFALTTRSRSFLLAASKSSFFLILTIYTSKVGVSVISDVSSPAFAFLLARCSIVVSLIS